MGLDAPSLEEPAELILGWGLTPRCEIAERQAPARANMLRKILLFLCGSILLIVGMTLILKNWDAVVIVFKAVVGMILAVGGLVTLSFIPRFKNSAMSEKVDL